MKNRPNGGLTDYDLQRKMNEKNLSRKPLINEKEIDITGKSASQVLEEAIRIIGSAVPLTEYDYEKPDKERFYSWVFANGLR